MAMTTMAKWALVTAIGLTLSSLGAGVRADSGWVSASTAAYTEATGALLHSNSADTSTEVAYADELGADSYDSYTCVAAYGDAFCAAFERCMAAHGFRACYERFSR